MSLPYPGPHQALPGISLHAACRTQRRGGCAIARKTGLGAASRDGACKMCPSMPRLTRVFKLVSARGCIRRPFMSSLSICQFFCEPQVLYEGCRKDLGPQTRSKKIKKSRNFGNWRFRPTCGGLPKFQEFFSRRFVSAVLFYVIHMYHASPTALPEYNGGKTHAASVWCVARYIKQASCRQICIQSTYVVHTCTYKRHSETGMPHVPAPKHAAPFALLQLAVPI